MMNESATMTSCPRQPCQLRLEQPPDLLVGDSARAQSLYGGGNNGLRRANLVGQLLRSGTPRDERAGAVAQLDDPFVFELAVRLGDRVWVDHEFLRQGADARQLLPWPHRARLDGVFHLLHQLEVDRNTG